jgi:hypothetical protein
MNRYGQMALEHWSRWLPQRVAGIGDPESFFSTLGLDVARQIEELADRLAGLDRPGETYLQKLGRLREARMSAESDILREEVLLAPDNETDQTPFDHRSWPGQAPWTSVTQDPTDSVWQQDLAQLEESEQP